MGNQNRGQAKQFGKTNSKSLFRKSPGTLRKDLTPEQYIEALRIGRVEFKSAGATRKR